MSDSCETKPDVASDLSEDDAGRGAFERPLLVFVGGLLGAGKTSLILKAAHLLRDRGQRVAVIMNDQDAGLVDSRQSAEQGIATQEVAGGCFCCRFSELMDAAEQLTAYGPQVVFAEPVGSCVDLAATILQPLLSFHSAAYRLAPLTVLLDPGLLPKLDRGDLHPDLEFLFRHQLAEADLVCLTKNDLYPDTARTPFPVDFNVSARTGTGVENWLNEVLASNRVVGARILDVDYSRYAEAEAALGWLNLQGDLHLLGAASPASVVGPLLDLLERQLTRAGIVIAHLKIFDKTSSGWVRGSVIANGEEPIHEGDLLAEAVFDHQLAINLRALADPAALRNMVLQTLDDFGGHLQVGYLGAFRPPPPVPQHRFTASVASRALTRRTPVLK